MTQFTFGERTSGLFRASLAIIVLFLIIAGFTIIAGLLSGQPYVFALVFTALVFAVPITIISCQLFGHPIWLLADVLKLNGDTQSVCSGAFTGVIMQVAYGYLITEQISFHPVYGTIMAVTGAICGAIAFAEAEAKRRERLDLNVF